MPSFRAPDGTDLSYQVDGSGEPLLLIAGQSSDRRMWDEVRDDFAARHTVITWDHRGTGHSDKPTEPPYSTLGFAADAVSLLDHLGIARAHAYGISMGGRIGQWLGIRWPQRIGALVLGATTPGNAHGVRRPAEVDARVANRPTDLDELVAFWVGLMVSPEWAAAHPEYAERLRQKDADPIPDHAQRLHYLASEGHDAWDELPKITAPTLVIHGDADQANVPANAPLLVSRIPGAQLHLVAGGRHGYFVEFREKPPRSCWTSWPAIRYRAGDIRHGASRWLSGRSSPLAVAGRRGI